MALTRNYAVLAVAMYCFFGLGLSAVPAVSGVAAAMTYSAVLLSLIAKRLLNKAGAYFIVVATYITISAFWADTFPLVALGTYVTAASGALLVLIVRSNNWMSDEQLICLLLIPSAINAFAYITGQNIVTTGDHFDDYAAMRRFGGFTGHPNALTTRALIPLFAFTLMAGAIRRTSLRLVLGSLAISAALFAIYATGSRKGVLIALPLLIAIVARSTVYHRSKLRRWISCAVIMCLLVPFVLQLMGLLDLGMLVGEDLDIEVFRRFDLLMQGTDDSASERGGLVSIGLLLAMKAPVFGLGLDQFSQASGYGAYSHNNMVELAVNTGVVGVILYYSLVCWAFSRLWESGRRVITLMLILTMLALDVTGVSYSDRGTQVMLALLLSIAATRFQRT